MSEDLRADHVKVEIKSLYFNKKLFFCPAIGGGAAPLLVYASVVYIHSYA